MRILLSVMIGWGSCAWALGADEFEVAGPKLSPRFTARAGQPAGEKAGSGAAKASRRAENSGPAAGQPDLQTPEQKREWLRQQAVKGLSSARQIRQVHAQVDRMTPQQIDRMVNGILAQQLPQDDPQQVLQQAQLELARARALRQMLEQEYWRVMAGGYVGPSGYGAPIGYMPIVTWLPSGTSFGASAVISGDRRYVRVSPMPFFSSVGPVYSYNLNTGETRLMPEYGQPQPYGYPNGYPYGLTPPSSQTRPAQSTNRRAGWYPVFSSGQQSGSSKSKSHRWPYP